MEKAYLGKDFAAVARLAMQDSNQFHATCLDTYPPIFYLNDVSRAIIGLVHAFNGSDAEPRSPEISCAAARWTATLSRCLTKTNQPTLQHTVYPAKVLR